MPEDAAWADPVVVPDDIRELQHDVDAYHRELRMARRRRRWSWLLTSPAWQRWSFPLGVVTGALGLSAVVFTVLAVSGAGRTDGRGPMPLARPAVSAGAPGGLLPDVTLTTSTGATTAARALRPALVALIPVHCSCPDLLNELAAQASGVRLRLVVVGPDAPDAEVAALPGQLRHANVVAAFDHGATLASTYAAKGVTALVVGRDGVVGYIRRDVTPGTRLELPLQAALLVGTGARS
jgi:hypothetical protein